MAPGFQSSFIPKDPITPDVFKKKKTGVFGILAVSLFIFSIILAIAISVYKGIVKTDIVTLQTELAAAEQNLDKDAIKRMMEFSQKLEIVKNIVAKHQVMSGFLNSLSSSTASTVSFTDFSYSALGTDGLAVKMKGKTNSYSSVAFQESIFLKNKYWKSVVFSNLALGEKGTVTFDVTVLIDPQIVAFNPPVTATTTQSLSEDLSVPDTDLSSLDNIGSDLDNL